MTSSVGLYIRFEFEMTYCNLAGKIKLLSHAGVVDSLQSHLHVAFLVTLTVIHGKERLYFVDYKLLASKD